MKSLLVVVCLIAFCCLPSYCQDASGIVLDDQLVQNNETGQQYIQDLNGFMQSGESGITLDDLNTYLEPVSPMPDCCMAESIPPLIESSQRTVSYSCTTYYPRHRYTCCGWWGLRRCTITYTSSRRSTCTRQSTQYHSVEQLCPDDLLTCCEGAVWFMEKCVAIDQLKNIVDYLKAGGNGLPPIYVVPI